MKAHRAETKPAFVPVVITLESQEEVDEMHAILSHSVNVEEGSVFWDVKAWEALRPFASGRHDHMDALSARAKLWARRQVARS